jgi:hypothetical protein
LLAEILVQFILLNSFSGSIHLCLFENLRYGGMVVQFILWTKENAIAEKMVPLTRENGPL